MGSTNSVIIQGNLVREPEISQLTGGTYVANFTVAVNRNYLKRDGTWHNEVSYFDCVAWAEEAQRCNNHLKKGHPVKVVGRLKQERWQDKEGNPHSKVKIISEYFERQYQPEPTPPKERAAQAEAMHMEANTSSRGAAD
ncbi:MAG: single-stranded DNA-binding protein [Spirochaetota bacterium]